MLSICPVWLSTFILGYGFHILRRAQITPNNQSFSGKKDASSQTHLIL